MKRPADYVFDLCVDLLKYAASRLGITYNEINVYIFCIAWPLFTAGLILLAVYQRGRIKSLTEQISLFRK